MKEYTVKITRTIEFNTVVKAENDEDAKLEATEHFYDFLFSSGYEGVDNIEIKQIKEIDNAK